MKRILVICILSGLSVIHLSIDAYCAKCERIERERAAEQAKNPPRPQYFDDPLAFESVTSKDSDKNISNPEIHTRVFDEHPSTKPVLKESKKTDQGYSVIANAIQTKGVFTLGEGPITYFIPTDEAILKIDPLLIRKLLNPESPEALSKIISDHVVKAFIDPSDFTKFKSKEIKSLSGHNLTLDTHEDKLFIDGVEILRSIRVGPKTIIYITDQVLVQPQTN